MFGGNISRRRRLRTRSIAGPLALVAALLSSMLPIGAAGGAPAGASIASVSFAGSLPHAPTVIVTGSGFGSAAPPPTRAGLACEAGALGAFYANTLSIHDLTGGWSAGHYAAGAISSFNGIVIDSWAETRVTFHFDGCWTDNGKSLYPGDAIAVTVRGVLRRAIVPDPKSAEPVGASGIKAPGTFVGLSFPTAPAPGWSSTSIDVRVLRAPLSDPHSFYYYALQWELKAPGTPDGLVVGYMGLQTQGNNVSGVDLGPVGIFSFFTPVPLGIAGGTGTDGQPASCETSAATGEGFISTCRVRFAWQPAHTYRYAFRYAGPGQWTATITDRSAPNRPVVTIGTFTVPVAWLGIDHVDAGFLEQYVSPPETTDKSHPVCPSSPQHRTTAQYLNARVNDTVAPEAVRPGLHRVNDVGTALVCQNATARRIPGGVQLDMDLRAPAAPTRPRAVRAGRSVTISWTPRRNPATVTRGQLENAMLSTEQLAAIAAIARPLPTSYTVSASPGGQHRTVSASQARVTFGGLRHQTTYRFTIVASNGSGRSAPISVTIRIPVAPKSLHA
jgi:hypothetical protein